LWRNIFLNACCINFKLTHYLLAGCADESHQAPVTTSFRGSGPGETEPEPVNSLPRGAAVDAPLTSRVGDIGSTRVGPAVRGVAPSAPTVSSRY